MEKRIHAKRSMALTYRHYLFHFKWPLLGFLFLSMFVSFNPMNVTSYFYASDDYEDIMKVSFTDVIYPLDVFKQENPNRSILYHFQRKNALKAIDDMKSVGRREKVILPFKRKKSTSSSYLILEFTHVFAHPRFCSHKKEEIFGKTCPYTNCDYTCDLKREKDANVLLMHKRDLDAKKLETMTRKSEQIWLLWQDESNENSTELNKYKFNWTITYRLSAEASLGAYGITTVKEKRWSINQLTSWIDEQFNNRHNQAVWFVSNCRPKKRLAKFRSLRQYFSIAAFGKCIPTNQSLSLNAYAQSEADCGRQSSCEKLYLSTSKFYLAFESQSCTDYITEKFWRTLSSGAIPIVSGPDRKNYARIAPPHSFIHVDDYTSERELANALNLIGTNRTLYGEYHAWRRYYDVYSEAKDVDPYRFCELCYRLNTNKQRIWYENINDWLLEKC